MKAQVDGFFNGKKYFKEKKFVEKCMDLAHEGHLILIFSKYLISLKDSASETLWTSLSKELATSKTKGIAKKTSKRVHNKRPKCAKNGAAH